MFKSFAIALAATGVAAYSPYGTSSGLQAGVYQGEDDFTHDYAWGHDHYEPGNIKRFDGHFAEIYGADDLAWGANGFQNPIVAKDGVHNWDDQGDAYTCHSCGGHGCSLCGGYGHFHRNKQFGKHGHTLQNGFGVGHWHAYLGPKNRSSYNKYGHGIGGRYTQRWNNGYGDRYGINSGQRYGLAHRWSLYNGYGKGNASAKGSVMGYGIGTNAETQVILNDQQGHRSDDYDWTYADDYGYGDDYGYDEGYGDDWGYDEEPVYDQGYDAEYEEPAYEEDYGYDQDYDTGYDEADEYHGYGEDHYMPEHNGQHYYTEWAAGYGDNAWPGDQTVGRSSVYWKGWSNGHGNHNPWDQESQRHDRGLMNYVERPREVYLHHDYFGFPV